jgi:hypothetical protein
VQRKQGKIQDAITSFKNAAELYIVQKDKENARLCLDKIQQLKPKSQPTPNIANSKPAPINYIYSRLLHTIISQGRTGSYKRSSR